MVVMVWVFHHLDEPVALLKNLKPSLRPGATVVILDPDPQRNGEKDSDRPSSEASVRKEAEAAGFELVKVETFLPRDTIFILRAMTSA
jgi:SAM-dependent methyltransferase